MFALMQNMKGRIVRLTICSPRNQTPGTMCHVKGPRWIRKFYCTKNTNNSRDTSLQGKLHLCLMRISWCK